MFSLTKKEKEQLSDLNLVTYVANFFLLRISFVPVLNIPSCRILILLCVSFLIHYHKQFSHHRVLIIINKSFYSHFRFFNIVLLECFARITIQTPIYIHISVDGRSQHEFCHTCDDHFFFFFTLLVSEDQKINMLTRVIINI